jgi:hypothetical protein
VIIIFCYYLLQDSHFWSANVANDAGISSSTVFTGTTYTDYSSLFGSTYATTANVVTAFRYISSHFELINTANQTQWGGSITTFKVPIKVGANLGVNGVTNFTVTGLQSVNSTKSQTYCAPFIQGVYTAAYNNSSQFEFSQVPEGIIDIPNTLTSDSYGQLAPSGGVGFTGFDNSFESVVIRVACPTGSTNSCILRTWACVEY